MASTSPPGTPPVVPLSPAASPPASIPSQDPVTPPNSGQALIPLQPDTPAVLKVVDTPMYTAGGLTKGREALMKDFGSSIPQYTVEQFLTEVLPPLRRGMNVHKILRKLGEGETPAIKDGRWSWFPEDPSQMGEHENTTFKPLEKIAEAICTASGLSGKYHKLLDFNNNPNGTPMSLHRVSTSRPDGYLVSTVEDGKTRWCDIALSAEYKLHNNETNRQDDMMKVAWSMHQCMREDPCRRFTYGLTIEDTETRFWFCSRGGALVSEPFNFITDCDIMVEFFLRFMYAEKHEVGWDPTMERVKETTSDGNAQPRYDITMRAENGEEVKYRTMEMLSDIGANPLRGRGTRVWKVKKLVNGDPCGEYLVLKDCWIDCNRTREGNIMRQIQESGPPDDKEFRDCLLTVVCHGDVQVKHGERDDTHFPVTRNGGQWRKLLADFNIKPELPDAAPSDDHPYPTPTGTGSHMSPVESSRRLLLILPTYYYVSKVHYRIAFAEVCQPLHSLTHLNNIYGMLSKATRALQGLHERGWVHRDVSTGNLLIYNGGIKLSDLEYAKRMNDIKGHEVRTGTADFIACEVEDRKYLFAPRNTIILDTNDDPSSSDATFRYNPLHDLESVWWIANFFTFNKGIVRIGESPQSYDQTPQLQVAEDVFYSRRTRYNFLRSGNLTREINTLHSLIRAAVRKTEFIQTALCERYTKVEKDPQSISGTAADGLHQPIALAYSIISIKLPKDTIIGDLVIPKKQETRVSPLVALPSNRALSETSEEGQEKGKRVDTVDETESSVAAELDQIKIPKQRRTRQRKSRTQGSSEKSEAKAQRTQGGEASSGPTAGLRKSARLANAKKGSGSRLG